jgi:hypothetical protein
MIYSIELIREIKLRKVCSIKGRKEVGRRADSEQLEGKLKNQVIFKITYIAQTLDFHHPKAIVYQPCSFPERNLLR